MVKVAEYLGKNMDVFRRMVSIGAVPPSYLNYYRIYCFYKTTEAIKSKMDRYYFTSDTMKVGVNTVRDAVKVMESRI